MLGRICAALLALAAFSAPAASETIESIYTSFDAKKCKHQKGNPAEEDYGSWICPGYQNLRVHLSAGDQRMYVTFGPWNKDALATAQTFQAFNDVYQGTVEWRIAKNADGKAQPFATILRWNVFTRTDHDKATGPINASGRVLVVTRLGPGGVCHVGYVDAKANPDANALARKIADETARTFKCGKDKRIVVGKIGDVDMPKDKD
jgi:hypothetical protein